MANPERGGLVEKYKNFNKLTLAGAIGVAVFGSLYMPVLVGPAIGAAILDAGQLFLIDEYQKSKKTKSV